MLCYHACMINAEALKNITKDELLELINAYEEKCEKQSTRLDQQSNTLSPLREQLKLARHKRFGSPSEKS